MASIQKRKNKDGTSHWRAVVRIKGYPTVCDHFERKQEAEDWAVDTERQIKLGQYKPERIKASHTFSDLIARFLESGALEHHKSAKDALRHIAYWKERFTGYALVHLQSELIAKERRVLQDTPTLKGKPRNTATVNRYMASLSTLFTYACRELRWIAENPCALLIKLKEASGRDRTLSSEEINRLLIACQESKSLYLYAIVLIALTTGMRQGEILGLEWSKVDFEGKLAHLKDSKNGRPRSIPLVEPVIEELRSLYSQRDPSKVLVFASRTAFGQVDIKKAWQEALKRAKITGLRFHDLRHTFATLAARQGASNLELAAAMGHRTLQMLQRYTHLEGELTRKYSDGITKNFVQEKEKCQI